MVVGVLAIGQTLVILTAGIDLSCRHGDGVRADRDDEARGGQRRARRSRRSLLGILACVGFGLLNGALVTGVRLPAFIVTLGTLNIAFALTHIVSNDLTFSGFRASCSSSAARSRSPAPTSRTASSSCSSCTRSAWYALTPDGLGPARLRRRRQPGGRAADGDQHEPSPVQRLRARRPDVRASPRCCSSARTELGDPNAGQTTENLDSITAVVLGGTSLFGGRGNSHRNADRRGDRRRLPQRPDADRRRGDLPVPRHRHPRHPRRLGRPARRTGGGCERRGSPILEARGLVKRYGQVVALDGADFELYPDEILAIIGDNGAGKSTLIKALSGALQPDEGEIRLDGERVHFRSPRDARRAGIETVYQDLAVAPALDIAVQHLPRPRAAATRPARAALLRMLDKRRDAARGGAALRRARRSASSRSTQPVENLSGGQRQGVAVARAATWARRLVIMDEPTAALGVKETRQVLDLIRRVRERGLPVILISHDMPHVFELADRIQIMRLGRRVAVVTPQTHSMPEAVAIMTGATQSELDRTLVKDTQVEPQ